jgi:hypothetical protein
MAPSGIDNPQVIVLSFYSCKGEGSRPPVVGEVFLISPQVSIPNVCLFPEKNSVVL